MSNQKTSTSIRKAMQREAAAFAKHHKAISDVIFPAMLRRMEEIISHNFTGTTMHPSDGNTYALNKHLAERERYEDAQIRDMYCPACDEVIDGPDWPQHVKDETCPNCAGELEETP